jgi:putative two-component system response regulator
MGSLSASIMIVDDNESVRRILARILGQAGYVNVVAASSTEEARALFSAGTFDLLVTDMVMPGGSGLELLKHVRHHSPDTATIMITGIDDAKLAESALDLGTYGHIIKPFKINEVLINVDSALRRKAGEIENRTDTIHRLAIAAEFRDSQTGRHVARMSRYCEMLAEASGQSDELIRYIREASSLHDVGKIGIPDRVLLKPALLSEDERTIMQEHASIGSQILSGSSSQVMVLAATIAATHHEWVDGTGYPKGLKGQGIPVAGRIAAIADVFDALINDRPYRRAMPVLDAVDLMKAGSGTHFDSDLLAIFWTILSEALRVVRLDKPKSDKPSATKVLEGSI